MKDLKISTTTAESPAAIRAVEATGSQKRFALFLVGFCHTLNHLQYSITSVLYCK
jgi:hypothetical protein